MTHDKRVKPSMWSDVRSVYRHGLRAALLFPVLFLIPALVEFAQHVVELQLGMYEGIKQAKAVEGDQWRLGFGFAKVLAISIPQYWFIRWMGLADPGRAARVESPAFGLWLVISAFNTAQVAWTLFFPPLGEMLGLTGPIGKWIGPAISTAWTLIGVYLMAWVVAWPLGNRAIGPLRSFSVMSGSFWRTIGYMVACILPFMVLHYALGFLAITVTPAWLDGAVLAFDALVVALLACCMAGAGYIAAAHAAARNGIDLLG